MNINKEYRRGGFFGSSQDKFEDKSGSGGGVNMAFRKRGVMPFGIGQGKGSALRREKRYLKKLARQGRLNESGSQSQERLDYLRNVQKDRAKKIGAGIGLAAGAAFGAPALAGAIKAKGGLGAALQGLKGKGILQKASRLGNLFGGRKGGNTQAASQFSAEEQEQAMQGNFGQPDMYGKNGMRVLKEGGLVGDQKVLDKNNNNRLDAEDFRLLRAMLGARLPR